jgi:hypothetical protein
MVGVWKLLGTNVHNNWTMFRAQHLDPNLMVKITSFHHRLNVGSLAIGPPGLIAIGSCCWVIWGLRSLNAAFPCWSCLSYFVVYIGVVHGNWSIFHLFNVSKIFICMAVVFYKIHFNVDIISCKSKHKKHNLSIMKES